MDTEPTLPLPIGQAVAIARREHLGDGSVRFTVSVQGQDVMDTEPTLPLPIGQAVAIARREHLGDGSVRFTVSVQGQDVDFALDARHVPVGASICRQARSYKHHPGVLKVQVIEGVIEDEGTVSDHSVCLLCVGEARRLRSPCPSNVRSHGLSHDENESMKMWQATRNMLVGIVMEEGLSPSILESRRVRQFFEGAPAVSVEFYSHIEEKVSAEAMDVVRRRLRDRPVVIMMDEATVGGRQWLAVALATREMEVVVEWAPLDAASNAATLVGVVNYALRNAQVALSQVVAVQTDSATVMRAAANLLDLPWGPCGLHAGNLVASEAVQELEPVLDKLIGRINALAHHSSWIRFQDSQADRLGMLKRLVTSVEVRFLTRFGCLASLGDNQGPIMLWQGPSEEGDGLDKALHAPSSFEKFTENDFFRAAQIVEVLRPLHTFMLQSEKNNRVPGEVTGAFAFLPNCGQLVSEIKNVARNVATRTAEHEELGSPLPAQIGRVAVRARQALITRLKDYHARCPQTMRLLATAALLNPRVPNIINAARTDLPEVYDWLLEAEAELRTKCETPTGDEGDEAVANEWGAGVWGESPAREAGNPLDRWRESVAGRRVNLPEGIAGYWLRQLEGEHAALARIAEPLLAMRGSTRCVEGFFSLVRRAFPPEVLGPANYSTIRRRGLLLALPEIVPEVLDAVFPAEPHAPV